MHRVWQSLNYKYSNKTKCEETLLDFHTFFVGVLPGSVGYAFGSSWDQPSRHTLPLFLLSSDKRWNWEPLRVFHEVLLVYIIQNLPFCLKPALYPPPLNYAIQHHPVNQNPTPRTIHLSNISILMTLLLEERGQGVRALSNKVILFSTSAFPKSNFHLHFYNSFRLFLSLRRAVIFWNALFDVLLTVPSYFIRGYAICNNWERFILSRWF
jgi:hypothetical protein